MTAICIQAEIAPKLGRFRGVPGGNVTFQRSMPFKAARNVTGKGHDVTFRFFGNSLITKPILFLLFNFWF